MTEKEADALLDDSPSTKKAKAVKKGAAKAKAKVAKKAAKAAKNGDGSMGRPASEQTIERRKKVMQYAKAKDGIDNVSLAEKLGCTTAQSQTVCRSLVAAGKLKLNKDRQTGRVTYKVA